MPKRFCTCDGCPACQPPGCRAVFDKDDPRSPGLRCPGCQVHATKRRNTDRPGRPSAAQRGYGTEWRRISAEVTANATQCHWCSGPFSEDNPATADHIVPVARGGTHQRSNLVPACRRCNSRRGGQMRKRTTKR